MRQKHLGERGLVVLITFLSAFVPLSTDLYLPALPGMAEYFGVSSDLANLTLILFFVFFAAGNLFWGPQSDKYGRRPILIISLSIYSLAGFLCAGSEDIYYLIIFRILQAIGGSGAFSVATAIIKDAYDSKNRETILALVQSMVLISPMAAPVLGAFLLSFTTWRGVFLILGGIGLFVLALSVALGSSGAGAENPRLFRGGMNRAPPRLLSLCGIAIYPPRSITVLLGLLPAVEKTQAARTKPRKQLAWDHMPSVERP